jgi:DNA-binding PadR family transcriptional regulator
MHPYRMLQLIKQRGKDKVVNIAQRFSIYQTIDRLLRSDLIAVQATGRAERRPERTVYTITPAGQATLHDWLGTILSTPPREFPDFRAALSFVTLLQPADVLRLLEQRLQALQQQLAELDADLASVPGLPRVFLIEDEYQRSIVQAERDWVQALASDLRSGRLSWSEAWLREQAALAESYAPLPPAG